MYRVTISTGGLVYYAGEAFVERMGRHEGEVNVDRVMTSFGSSCGSGSLNWNPSTRR